MVRAVRFYECGGPEVLKIETIEVSQPKQDEARVKIQSIGLNRAELAFRTGYYLEKAVFPSLLG